VELKAGDMVYFEPHLALGVLIEKRGDDWVYSLRSPPRNDVEHFMIKTDQHAETAFIADIESGRLKYYASR